MRVWLGHRDVEGSELVRRAWSDLTDALAFHLRVEGVTIESMELRTTSGSLISLLDSGDRSRAAFNARMQERLAEAARLAADAQQRYDRDAGRGRWRA